MLFHSDTVPCRCRIKNTNLRKMFILRYKPNCELIINLHKTFKTLSGLNEYKIICNRPHRRHTLYVFQTSRLYSILCSLKLLCYITLDS